MIGKAPAALTSALIVRKGGASPAGYIGPRTAAPAPASARPAPRRVKTEALAALRPKANQAGAAGSEGQPRARITLRLDPQRHLRLKLAAAHLDRSLQDIMTVALDAYLDQLGATVVGGRCICLTDDTVAPTD